MASKFITAATWVSTASPHRESDEALPIQWYYEPMEAALRSQSLGRQPRPHGHHASAYDKFPQLRLRSRP